MTAGTRGNFFAVERPVWELVCKHGMMNPEVAFLVLARFTGGDQQTTHASTNAIEKYTGVSRSRAREAIGALETLGVTTPPKGPQGRPTRQIKRASGIHLSPSAKCKRDADWIWLPNAFVDGAAGEIAPLELARQTGDPKVLQLLVDLYHQQNLAENGGVHWRRIRYVFEKSFIARRGALSVWAFSPKCKEVWPNTPFVQKHMTGDQDAGGKDTGLAHFWGRWDAIVTLGLIEEVPHLIDSDTNEGEIIHPFAVDNGEPFERELAAVAQRAAVALLTDVEVEQARSRLGRSVLLAPVPAHLGNVALVGIARLRYRPRTAATAAWLDQWHERCAKHRVMYERILNTQQKDDLNRLSPSGAVTSRQGTGR